MLIWTDEYSITTLCKPEQEKIDKAERNFQETIARLKNENPKFIGHIIVGRMRVEKRHDIEVTAGRTISVVRLRWKIKGDHDILESFLRKWKELDENPYTSYFVHAEHTLSQIAKMVSIKED